MRGKPQVLFVAPEDGWFALDRGFGEKLMKVYDLVSASVSDDDEESAVAKFYSFFN